jgi:hypothetical protein
MFDVEQTAVKASQGESMQVKHFAPGGVDGSSWQINPPRARVPPN